MLRERDVQGLPATTRFAAKSLNEPKHEGLGSDTGREEAHRVLKRLAGKRVTISTDRLEEFDIHYTDPIRLKDGSYDYANESVVLEPTSPVFTRQARIKSARVAEYIDMLANGDDVEDPQVTDIVPGGGHWHLNGLHRMVAARLLDRDINAQIWR